MNINWNELLNEAFGAALGTAIGLGFVGYIVFSLVANSLEAVF